MVNIIQNNSKHSIQITSTNTLTEIKPHTDSSLFYSNKAKDWACKMNSPVDSTNYSSKHYANIAKEIIENPGIQIISEDMQGNNNITICAENISSIQNAKNNADIATEKAKFAKEQADIINNNVQEITSAISSKASIDLDNLSETGKNIIQNNANKDLSNLSPKGQAIIDNKAEKNLSNCPSNYNFIKEQQVTNNGSWFRKYRNGWLEQCITCSTSVDAVANFLRPFKNTLYTVSVGWENRAGGNYFSAGLDQKKTTSIRFHMGEDSTSGKRSYIFCQGEGA